MQGLDLNAGSESWRMDGGSAGNADLLVVPRQAVEECKVTTTKQFRNCVDICQSNTVCYAFERVLDDILVAEKMPIAEKKL